MEGETINPKCVMIWRARYHKQDVPLWAGPLAAMPKDYYFRTKEKLQRFINDNKKIEVYFDISQTLAFVHENVYYPFTEGIIFKDT